MLMAIDTSFVYLKMKGFLQQKIKNTPIAKHTSKYQMPNHWKKRIF